MLVSSISCVSARQVVDKPRHVRMLLVNRSGLKCSNEISQLPSRARSATISPTAAACLNPCPEHPPARIKWGARGVVPTMKSRSGVLRFMQGHPATTLGVTCGRARRQKASAGAMSFTSSGRQLSSGRASQGLSASSLAPSFRPRFPMAGTPHPDVDALSRMNAGRRSGE